MSREDRIAESLELNTKALACVVTELRMQRIVLHRVAAKLDIEIDDREQGDVELGKLILEHEQDIERLKAAE